MSHRTYGSFVCMFHTADFAKCMGAEADFGGESVAKKRYVSLNSLTPIAMIECKG